MKIYWIIMLGIIVCTPIASAQQISWNVIATGGGETAQSDIQAALTIGQTFIGKGEVSNVNGGIGFWYSLSNIITSLELTGPGYQEEIMLYQNAPNPFNDISMIKFSLPGKLSVQLELLDERGQVLTILLDAILNKGTYQANIDGSGLSPGVYFYRLTAMGKSWTKKCAVIK